MQPEVTLKIDAIDNTKAALQSVQRGLGNVQKSTANFRDRVEKLQPTFQRMAAVGAASFAGVAYGIGRAVEAAGQAEEIETRFAATFDSAEDRVRKFASEFAKEFKRTESSILAMSATLGGTLRAGTNLGEEGIADINEELILAAEGMAAFDERIVDGNQAMSAFAKALTGNTATLLDWGYAVRQTDIEAKALEMGLIEAGEAIDGTARAQATAALIMEQSQGPIQALNDAEGTYAETKRRVAAQTTELAETLGKTFLPMINETLQKITPVIDKIANWVNENEELATKIGIAAAAVAGIVAVIGTLGMVLLPIISAFKIAAITIAAIASPIGLVVAAVAALGYGLWKLYQNWDTVWAGIKGITSKVMSGIGGVLEKGKDVLKGFANFYIGTWEGIANVVVTAVNTIIRALNSIDISIPSWVPGIGGKSFGIDLPTVPKIEIPRLAEGGIVTQSTLANIGEAGPEAVIPLDRLDMAGGPNITINISGTFLDDRDAARRMGDEIMRALRREVRL